MPCCGDRPPLWDPWCVEIDELLMAVGIDLPRETSRVVDVLRYTQMTLDRAERVFRLRCRADACGPRAGYTLPMHPDTLIKILQDFDDECVVYAEKSRSIDVMGDPHDYHLWLWDGLVAELWGYYQEQRESAEADSHSDFRVKRLPVPPRSPRR